MTQMVKTVRATELQVGDRFPAGGTVRRVRRDDLHREVEIWTWDTRLPTSRLRYTDHAIVRLDAESSASRQHYIDTGEYLTYGEVTESRALGI